MGMGDEVTCLASFLYIMTMGEDLDGIVRFGGPHPIAVSPIVLVHPQDFSGDPRQFEGHLRDIYNQLDILDFCMKDSPQLHYANFHWHKCVHEYKIMDDNVIFLHMTQYYQYDHDNNWSSGWYIDILTLVPSQLWNNVVDSDWKII